MTFSHVHLRVGDLGRSTAFYERALSPLGLAKSWDDGHLVEFGDLALSADGPLSANVHLAFPARSEDAVRAFHREAIAAGGRDNGKPGLRSEYADDYYAAYVLDPDGHNVEAVYRQASP